MKKNSFIKLFEQYNLNNPEINQVFLSMLSPRQLEIYYLKFNKDGSTYCNSSEVANFLGYSKQYINQQLKSIINKAILAEKEYKMQIKRNSIQCNISPKAKELINTIKKLNRLPKRKERNNNESEYTLKDGTDQRTYYINIQSKIKYIENKLGIQNITSEEKQILYDYYKIKEALQNIKNMSIITEESTRKKYIKSLVTTEKTQRILETIDNYDRKTNVIPTIKIIFKNKDSLKHHYTYLCTQASKIKEKKAKGKYLSFYEEQILFNYSIIKGKLEYLINSIKNKQNKQLSNKAQTLINTINTIQRLPLIKSQNNNHSEFIFDDGTDQRQFYINLKSQVSKILTKNNNQLSFLEKQKLYDYNVIETTIKNIESARKDNPKIEELIKTINILHRLPKRGSKNTKPEFTFEDGKSQRAYFEYLIKKLKIIKYKLENNIKITKEEKKQLKQIQRIDNVYSFYNINKKRNRTLIKELLKFLNINIDLNRSIINKSFYEVFSKIYYLIDNNYNLTDINGYLNPIFYMSDADMQKNYKISLESITNKYITGNINSCSSAEEISKIFYKRN